MRHCVLPVSSFCVTSELTNNPGFMTVAGAVVRGPIASNIVQQVGVSIMP